MTTILLNGSPSDTYSFPYYDYGTDTVYVGDDGGVLHKFTSIFRSGTPVESDRPVAGDGVSWDYWFVCAGQPRL